MNDAAVAIMSKIRLLYGGDEDSDQFLSFLPLGRPLTAADLSFADAEDGIATSKDTLNAAASFATQMNLIPVVETIWTHDGRLLWDEYEAILTQAVVADATLTEAEEAELAQARDLLFDETEVVDENGDTKTVTVESALLETYREHETAVREARIQHNTARLTTEHADDPEAEATAHGEEAELEAALERAETAWRAQGHKAAVEAAFADIDRLTDGSPQVAWSEWKAQFREAKASDLEIHREFFPTTVWPPGFYHADSESGWTTVTMDGSEINSLRDRWLADLPEGADGDVLEADVQADLWIDSLSVDLARVDLVRHWFVPSVLRSRVWTWRHDREALSDGGDPPVGSLPAYPVSLIFARNLSVDLDATDAQNEAVVASLQQGGLHTLGPMLLDQVPSTTQITSVTNLKQATFDPKETVAIRDVGDATARGTQSRVLAARTNPLVGNIADVLARTDASNVHPGIRTPLAKTPSTAFFTGIVNPAVLTATGAVTRPRPDATGGTTVRDHRTADSPRARIRDHRTDAGRPTRVRPHGDDRRPRPHRPATGRPRVRDHRRARHVVRARRGDTGPVTVNGRVRDTDAAGGDPSTIESVRITFRQEGTDLQKMVTTDGDGRYEVTLPTGRYAVTAHRYGYHDFPQQAMGGLLTVRGGDEQTFDLAMTRDPSEPTDIDTWESVQLIAIVCQTVPPAPNPDPSLTWPEGVNLGGGA
ncbi:carboxypeptidase-like regulatory domain-containing protein [Haloarcula salina]|uniref:carboxypeptidase-like regulatory domain-containing protein n=1 Tax=Haloarcula salina TaxID=1429914 RepID=UPI003C6FADF1